MLVAVVASVVVAGCGTGRDAGSAVGPADGSRGETSVAVPGGGSGRIVLPEGASLDVERLARVDDRSYDALVYAVVSAITGDGYFAVGTVVDAHTEVGEFDLESTISEIAFSEVFVGSDERRSVEVTSAVADLAIEPGTEYLMALDQSGDGRFVFSDGVLFDRVDGAWVLRPVEVEGEVPPVVLRDEDIGAVVADAEAYWAQRQEARDVDLKVSLAGAGSARVLAGDEVTVVVTGHLAGESMELLFCDVSDPGFLPTTHRDRCEVATAEAVTVGEDPVRAEVTVPGELDLGLGEPVRCEEVRCAVVAADLGWPAQVFAIAEL